MTLARAGGSWPPRRSSVIGMLLVFGATWINPIWPAEQALHSSLTVIAFALLWLFQARLQLGARDLFLIALFLSVHSIGSRWLYSNVPYDAWGRVLFGWSIDQQFGWTRNHFDRLVHFLFGVCFTTSIASYAMRRFALRPMAAFYVAICGVMIASLWYEWFELAIAMTMSGEDAEAYNGQQGDMWDAHKDMLLATFGSALWAWWYARAGKGAPA